MKTVYFDTSNFLNLDSFIQAIKLYFLTSDKLIFYIKGDPKDFVTLDENPHLIIEDSFDESELSTINLIVKGNEDLFVDYKVDRNVINLIYDKNKNRRLISVFDKDDISILKSNIFHSVEISKIIDRKILNPTIALISAYEEYKNLDFFNSYLNGAKFNGTLPLNELFNSKDDITLLDNVSAYYVFNTINSFNKAKKDLNEENKKKENGKTSFFSKKLFSSSNSDEDDFVNPKSILSFYFINLKENNKLEINLKTSISSSTYLKLFDDLEEISQLNFKI